jgi:hypothetical protein
MKEMKEEENKNGLDNHFFMGELSTEGGILT